MCQTLGFLVQPLLCEQENEFKIGESPAKGHSRKGWSLMWKAGAYLEPGISFLGSSLPAPKTIPTCEKEWKVPQILPCLTVSIFLFPDLSPACQTYISICLLDCSSWVSNLTCLKLTRISSPLQTCSSHSLPYFSKWQVCPSSLSSQTT